MGSPGTFSISTRKAKKIRNMIAERPPRLEDDLPRSAKARKFFSEVFSDQEWLALLGGREWRAAAGILTGAVSSARAQALQKQLSEWANKQGIGEDTPLINLGSQLLQRLDEREDLRQRDIIAFELASYALRQSVERLYAGESSPFDVDRKTLLQRLGKVDSDTALRTYIGAYLQQLVRYIMGGYQATAKEQDARANFLANIEVQGIPMLAEDFLKTLQKYSAGKYGRGRPLSATLKDLPDWLAKASQELLKAHKR